MPRRGYNNNAAASLYNTICVYIIIYYTLIINGPVGIQNDDCSKAPRKWTKSVVHLNISDEYVITLVSQSRFFVMRIIGNFIFFITFKYYIICSYTDCDYIIYCSL